jgi:epoxyqueuosine reductase QueG
MTFPHLSLDAIQTSPRPPRAHLSAEELRQLALECGAADAGVVSLQHPMLDEERAAILKSFPKAKSVISVITKMNLHSVRSPMRSVANHEFHHAGDQTDSICRALAHRLLKEGIAAMNEPMAFPMEQTEFPGKIWIISHKKVAVAAGLGHMGIHRNVIHPKFGNFILLGSLLIDYELEGHAPAPLDYNPCLECMLCVAACPVGAIGADGYFNFSACLTHNYREFMGGFTDWVKALTDSKSMRHYKERFDDNETVSVWQSLTYGANYKAAYCMAVCPAGEDVIGEFKQNKREFKDHYVKPLVEKTEVIYAVKGTDAEDHVKKRFPNKAVKFVGNGLIVKSIENFLFGSKLIFQPGKAKGVNMTVHFHFPDDQHAKSTFIIKDQTLEILEGHHGQADLMITANARNWIRFLNKDLNVLWALVTRKIKTQGPLKHFQTFGKLFPS